MRKFPATIRTASNKKTTDSVIPSTCEGTEYCKDEDDVLFALGPGDTFLTFYEIIEFVVLNRESYVTSIGSISWTKN